jgi:plasmid stabilization system protein ParE
MAYAVSLAARAERDLSEIYEHIHAAEFAAARRWFESLKREIFALQDHPNRCAVTPESKKIRHLLYGHKPRIYRVIYLVVEDQKRVYVLHIRHGARRRFRTREIL